MTTPVFRFAPSPNGYLHLGHALSALLNFDTARVTGGRLLLRVEDIDRTRCRPEYEAAIYEDLAWLGITWEHPVRRQSEHFADYRAALAKLEQRELIYPTFESRAEIVRLVAAREADGLVWPRDPDGAPLYPGAPHAMTKDARNARIAAGPLFFTEANERSDERELEPANPEVWGDVVLARKDTPTSYHLCVVVDDAAQGVTHVMRGQDLYAATGVHRLLQTLLGLPAPIYTHHRLILDENGQKLAKSGGSTGLRELRASGVTPRDIRRMIGLA
jgi:glutamyl-Q tRNA(Asp) synthetase